MLFRKKEKVVCEIVCLYVRCSGDDSQSERRDLLSADHIQSHNDVQSHPLANSSPLNINTNTRNQRNHKSEEKSE
jgi:hypothetical protein